MRLRITGVPIFVLAATVLLWASPLMGNASLLEAPSSTYARGSFHARLVEPVKGWSCGLASVDVMRFIGRGGTGVFAGTVHLTVRKASYRTPPDVGRYSLVVSSDGTDSLIASGDFVAQVDGSTATGSMTGTLLDGHKSRGHLTGTILLHVDEVTGIAKGTLGHGDVASIGAVTRSSCKRP